MLSSFLRKIPPTRSSWKGDPKGRRIWKRVRLQEEPREEAPLEEKEEIRSEFLEMFPQGKRKIWKKGKEKEKKIEWTIPNLLRHCCTNHWWWPHLGGLWCYHSLIIPSCFRKEKKEKKKTLFPFRFIDIDFVHQLHFDHGIDFVC